MTSEPSRPPPYSEPPSPRPRPRRYPLIAPVELTDIRTTARLRQVITDLSLFGCHISTQTMWPIGTQAHIRIAHDSATFEASSRVVYGLPRLGIGIVFTVVEPDYQWLLERWIGDLQEKMK
jgi:PilZ domain